MGEEGLKDYSRAPKRSPSRTFPEIEEKVLRIRKEKGYRKRRITYFLLIEDGIHLLREHHKKYLEKKWSEQEKESEKGILSCKVGL